MGRHRGLWLYWPRSDKVSVATTWSLHRGAGGRGSRGKRAWISRCFYLFTSQQEHCWPPGAYWRIWGKTPHGRYVFLSVYVLLNLFLSSTWDWALAERWLADKKEEEKVSFQHFMVDLWCSGNSPATANTILLWKHAGKLFTVSGAHCCLNAGAVYRCLSSVSPLNARLKKTELLLSWLNARHYFLDGRQSARWWRVRGRRTYHLQTGILIIDTVIVFWYWMIQKYLCMMKKSGYCISKLLLLREISV